MELLKDVLIEILRKEDCRLEVAGWELPRIASYVNLACVGALEQIRLTVSNRDLTDFQCVEEIILILEMLGSNGGTRHDF